MSRIGFLSTKCLSVAKPRMLNGLRRTFLSDAYQCRDAWEQRLESPLLKKVNLTNLYRELDNKYQETENISAVDADIFVNANSKSGFMEDVVDIVYKLRRSPETGNTPMSLHHAVVRLLLETGKINILFKILSDRLTYGIFPDSYCLKLLMDTFLKQEKFALAARVAVLPMFQEDYEDLLTTQLAIYSCHMYLKNQDQPWFFEEEIVPPLPEPKEVVKVRVKYIRKPYYDDHFDIKDPLQMVGKTICMFSPRIGGNELLASSYQLLGLTLYQKWDKVIELVESMVQSKTNVHREAVQLAKKSLEAKPVAEVPPGDATSSKALKPDPAKEAQEEAMRAELETKQRVSEKLSELPLTVGGDMLGEVHALVKESVKENQNRDIVKQTKLYGEWEEERVAALRYHQEQLRKAEILQHIEQQKKELVDRERELYFFDNQDKLDIQIEEKQAALSQIQRAVKIKEDKATQDADYVPPEVFKRFS